MQAPVADARAPASDNIAHPESGALAPTLARSPGPAANAALHEAGTAPAAGLDFRCVVVGRLLCLLEGPGTLATPMVALPAPHDEAGLRARSIVDLHGVHIGRPVMLMFEQGNPALPIVVGVLRDPLEAAPGLHPDQLEVSVDGHRVLLSARQELVLQCGKASLTLRQDGRVEVHGEDIVTRAAGANKVQGGSVQLN